MSNQEQQVTISKKEYESLKKTKKNFFRKRNKKTKKISNVDRLENERKNKIKKEANLKRKQEQSNELANLRAKELRLNSTESEKIFKVKLRLAGFNYSFQYPIHTKNTFYIVDFYLPKQGLVIEVDGEYHNDKKQKVKDSHRTKDLNKLGFKVLRVNNQTVKEMSEIYFKELIEKFIK